MQGHNLFFTSVLDAINIIKLLDEVQLSTLDPGSIKIFLTSKLRMIIPM